MPVPSYVHFPMGQGGNFRKFLLRVGPIVVLSIIGAKPLIDCFWNSRIHIAGHRVNFQGLFALLLAGIGMVLAFQAPKKPVSILVVVMSLYCIFRVAMNPATFEWQMKYLCSLSSFMVIPYLARELSRDVRRRRVFGYLICGSLLVVLVGAILQILGLFEYSYFDSIYGFGAVGRVSSFYDHPLDFARVMVWMTVFLMAIYFLAPTRWLSTRNLPFVFFLYFISQYLILRTTHRTSVLAIVAVWIYLALRTQKWRSALVIFALTASAYSIPNLISMSHLNARTEDTVLLSDVLEWRQFVDGAGLVRQKDKNGNRTGALVREGYTLARGRSRIWLEHLQWIKRFSLKDWVFGPRDFGIIGFQDEPHSQLLDLLESMGLLGSIIMFCLIYFSFKEAKTNQLWRDLGLIIFGFYFFTSEPLIMPTMMTMGLLVVWVPTIFDFSRATHTEVEVPQPSVFSAARANGI